MEIVKRKLYRLVKWEYFWLCLLVLVTLALHFAIINNPTEPAFDETHYVKDARLILSGQGSERMEHPPLGKLLVAFGMYLFGDKPLGWRIFPILFGTAGIIFFYLICRRLALSRRVSFLATFILATENQSFIQASIGMLDVFCVTFMLAAFWCYLRKDYAFSGVAICLAALTKLTAVLAFPAILLHWLLVRRDRPAHFTASMVLVPLLFVMLTLLFNSVIFRRLVDPFSEIVGLFTLSESLTFATVTHPFALRPWDWLLIPLLVPYWYIPHYIGSISFSLWALIIPTAIYLGFRAWQRKPDGIFASLWFASTYLLWLPLDIITDRVTYPYYFYPSVGAIALGLGVALSRLLDVWQTRKSGKLRWVAIISVALFLLIHIGIFVTLSPLTSYWKYPLPQ